MRRISSVTVEMGPETGIPVLYFGTGQPITTQVSNRRAGDDFTFSVPKSISLYLAVNGDKVVEGLIGEALDQTMSEYRDPDGNQGSQRLSAGKIVLART